MHSTGSSFIQRRAPRRFWVLRPRQRWEYPSPRSRGSMWKAQPSSFSKKSPVPIWFLWFVVPVWFLWFIVPIWFLCRNIEKVKSPDGDFRYLKNVTAEFFRHQVLSCERTFTLMLGDSGIAVGDLLRKHRCRLSPSSGADFTSGVFSGLSEPQLLWFQD